jgi:hypothetical protein
MKKEWTTPRIQGISFKETEGGIFNYLTETSIFYKTGS